MSLYDSDKRNEEHPAREKSWVRKRSRRRALISSVRLTFVGNPAAARDSAVGAFAWRRQSAVDSPSDAAWHLGHVIPASLRRTGTLLSAVSDKNMGENASKNRLKRKDRFVFKLILQRNYISDQSAWRQPTGFSKLQSYYTT